MKKKKRPTTDSRRITLRLLDFVRTPDHVAPSTQTPPTPTTYTKEIHGTFTPGLSDIFSLVITQSRVHTKCTPNAPRYLHASQGKHHPPRRVAKVCPEGQIPHEREPRNNLPVDARQWKNIRQPVGRGRPGEGGGAVSQHVYFKYILHIRPDAVHPLVNTITGGGRRTRYGRCV